MKIADLVRFAGCEMGTFGRLSVLGTPFLCYTLEPPWHGNKPSESCIPLGVYELHRGTFVAGGGYPNYELVLVPGRLNIEIHRGNTTKDTKGCILVGRRLGSVGERWAIQESKVALDSFLEAMGNSATGVLSIRAQLDFLSNGG